MNFIIYIPIFNIMDLSITNSHPRDNFISFDEKPHLYYIKGSNDNISVTTFIHSNLFPHFDADKIISKMMKSRNWKQSKYYGKTPDEIKEEWNTKSVESSEAGTAMHKCIELFYNNKSVDNHSIEYQYFLKFNNDHKDDLIPYRTEWIIFDEETKLAGSIDMLYKTQKNDDKHLIIYDWKRTNKITDENLFERGYAPLEHLPNSNYWHYALQLNIYKKILEKNYDKVIDEMYLLLLHPNNNSYIKIKLPVLKEEIENIFNIRKMMCQNYTDRKEK